MLTRTETVLAGLVSLACCGIACTRPALPPPAVAATLPYDVHSCAEDCQAYGECSSVQGKCVAVREEDCRQSRRCAKEGMCEPLDGMCVATTELDCRVSEICAEKERCVLNEEKHRCDDGKERNSTGLMATGIAVTGAGGASVIAGLLFAVLGAIPGSGQSERQTAAAGLLIGGVAASAIGIPMLVVGAGKVRRREPVLDAPNGAEGPRGASLSWSF